MVDLSTTYLGLNLKNPLVASASPLSEKLDTVLRLQDAGISAVVVYSLFEEQILRDAAYFEQAANQGADSHAEAATYLPAGGAYGSFRRYGIGPEKYLEHVHNLKRNVSIPVIASLNGLSRGGWVDYAARLQQTGADALELNLYSLPTDALVDSASLEDQYVGLVSAVCQAVDIPVAVKLSPFFTALPNFALRLSNVGVKGLVLFNRFYQADLDIENLEVVPNLVLSTSQELRLPLRWIAILYGRLPVDFALTSGVHTAADFLKALMAGASAVQVASSLLKYGVGHANTLLKEAEAWLEEKEYVSVKQMTGSMSQQSVADPATFERANYMKTLDSYEYKPAR